MTEGPYNPKTMNPNEMVSLINTPIVDIPPRLKLLHRAVLSRRFATPAESEAPIHRNQFSVPASASSSAVLLTPLQELTEQSLAIGFALGHTASKAIHENLEIVTNII